MKESEFHQLVGGRIRRDNRFSNDSQAVEIRGMIVSIKKDTGMNNQEIAELIGVSGATLSRAAGGRAGIKINSDGKSTTEMITNRLKNLLPKDEDYSI